MKSKKKRYLLLLNLVFVMAIGFTIPQNLQMPVQNASKADYNPESFWYYPWGKSLTHKGVDVFAKKGTPINSATKGFVLDCGTNNLGGNFVTILGPKWRLHYYAHLDSIHTKKFAFVNQKTMIGTVGNSGNAKGKAPHLHYQIQTIFPYPWLVDDSKQSYKKMFYLNPIDYF